MFAAALMVKNEAANLERCLTSVKAFAPQEIVVVDTGSTDETVKVAESYGAKVTIPDNLDDYFVETEHGRQLNFAKARNLTFRLCTAPWILYIDADETICPVEGRSPQVLHHFLANLPKEFDAVGLLMQDFRKGQKVGEWATDRIFRNGTTHFTGIVHNIATFPGQATFLPFVAMQHYGYDLTGKARKIKKKRVLGLLKKRIAEDPDDHAAMFYLAMACGTYDEPIEGYKWAKRYAAVCDVAENFNETIWYHLAITEMNLGKFDEALAWIQKGRSRFHPDLDLSYALLKWGIQKADPIRTAIGANDYITAYRSYDKLLPKMGGKFIFNRSLSTYALALYYSGFSAIESGLNRIKEMEELLSSVTPQLREELSRNAASLKNQFGFETGMQKKSPIILASR